MRTDTTAQVLRTLTEYRDDLIRTRTQTANRLHRLLVQLVPAGLPKRLTAEAAAQLLRPAPVRGEGLVDRWPGCSVLLRPPVYGEVGRGLVMFLRRG
ncbi:hypothetical protein [Nocardia carnea]|uniref:hypothetical protein n=1 Tax=Nocardia carnea TaxID=37328 RepID=UPI0005255390|nr:hypothetical protein [Nocardia carnea]